MDKSIYQIWAEKVDDELEQNQGWIDVYKADADKLWKNRADIAKARKLFRVYKPLSAYITIGKAEKGKAEFDLRYLGQSVGTINVNLKNGKVLLDAKDQKIKCTDNSYFGYNLGEFKNVDWHSEKAKAFRKFYKEYAEGKPRQDEHRVEEALFSEFEKTTKNGIALRGIKAKSICYITPIQYAGIRFHMMTALAACKSKDDKISISDKYRGGDIDVFCRWNKKLAIIEVKDEYKASESYELAIKQAISYAVFIRKIVRSEIRTNWLKLWGMENQYKKKMKFVAVAAMPYENEEQIPDFSNEIICLGDDTIELHCIGILKDEIDGRNGNVECIWK